MSRLMPLIDAIIVGDFDTLEDLARALPQDELNSALLRCFMFSDDPSVLSILINAGANINYQDHEGRSAIFLAVKYMRVDVIQLLIEQGCNVNLGKFNQSNCLHLAARRGNAEIVQMLLDVGHHRNVTNWGGNTALLIACRFGHTAVVERLLTAGCDPMIPNKLGHYPLHYAAFTGEDALVEVLLAHAACPDVRTHLGIMPVMLACERGHCAIVKRLAACSDLSHRETLYGGSALHWAVAAGCSECVLHLLAAASVGKGLSKLKSNLEVNNGDGVCIGKAGEVDCHENVETVKSEKMVTTEAMLGQSANNAEVNSLNGNGADVSDAFNITGNTVQDACNSDLTLASSPSKKAPEKLWYGGNPSVLQNVNNESCPNYESCSGSSAENNGNLCFPETNAKLVSHKESSNDENRQFKLANCRPVCETSEFCDIEGIKQSEFDLKVKPKQCCSFSSVYTVDLSGRTPLLQAVQSRRPAVISVLLDVTDLSPAFPDSTVLHMAAACGYRECVEILCGHPRSKHLINTRDCFGDTPLDLATRAAVADERPPPEVVDVIDLLLRHGAERSHDGPLYSRKLRSESCRAKDLVVESSVDVCSTEMLAEDSSKCSGAQDSEEVNSNVDFLKQTSLREKNDENLAADMECLNVSEVRKSVTSSSSTESLSSSVDIVPPVFKTYSPVKMALIEMLCSANCEQMIAPTWFDFATWLDSGPEAFVLKVTSLDMTDWLYRQTHSPWSLRELCRGAVRRTLGYRAHEKVRLLPLPRTLQEYLNMRELDEINRQDISVRSSMSYEDVDME